jgi:hypothetical protein
MERESFEDEEVADILNKHFVSIKVDREERPDIDNIYMTFCQAITGHGGWPLTVILTPDKKPIYAGTYFPKRSKYGRMGLIELLEKIRNMWEKDKSKLIDSSNELVSIVEKSIKTFNKEEIDKNTIHDTFEEFSLFFDSKYGGFGDAPKFPTPHNLSFLLRYWKATDDKKALDIVEKTLISMYKGGIFDHVGFGFSRYSVDKKWLIPHFEKMLYDNALLAIAYIEGYQVTGNTLFKEVAEKIFTYIFRKMTHNEGGFYSAEDADSEGEEGKFYLWTVDEIKSVLGDEDRELYCKYYDITEKGNFEGKNIPNLINTDLDDIENNKNLKNKLYSLNEKLYQYREKRIHPHKDDKILTSWNGLMVVALAIGYRVLNNEEYIDAAKKAVEFIFKNLVREDGRLLARYRDGESAYPAYLDDYAFLTWGLMELYRSTFEVSYLEKALKMTEDMIELFWDNEQGGFYLNGNDTEQLIVRPKEIYDGAIPSGNSVAALNMLILSRISGNEELSEKVDTMFGVFGSKVKQSPNAYSYFMMAALFNSIPVKEIVISGRKDSSNTKEMLEVVNQRFLPFSIVLLNDGDETLYKLVPFIKEQVPIEGKSTAYVCESYMCNEPTTDISTFKKLIDTEQRLK